MGKKGLAIGILAGAAMFAAGFLVRTAWDGYKDEQEALAAMNQEAAEEEAMARQGGQEAPEATAGEYLEADMVQVRIEDGQVQWFDGRLWHGVASVEELQRKDRFYLAEEAFREFDEQLRQEKAAARQAEAAGESDGEASEALSVGVKETPKPVQRPQSTSAPQAPVEVPVPAEGSVDSGGSSGGGNSGGGNSVGGNSGGEAPVAPPPVEEPSDSGNSGGDSGGDAGSDTGDGENMEWSDDYL